MYVPGYYNCCLSEYAVDGNITTWVYQDMICAHSSRTNIQQEWWAVDLRNVYVIKEIEIYGRTDCCREFQVFNGTLVIKIANSYVRIIEFRVKTRLKVTLFY